MRCGIDEVRDRLGLGEVELAVEERPFGELARPGRARAEGEDPAGHPVEDNRAAVTLKLQRVLTGIGVRGGKPEGEPGVQGLAVTGQEPGRGRDPRFRDPAHHRPRDLARPWTAHPHDSDSAAPGRSGDGGNGVRHALVALPAATLSTTFPEAP